MVCVLPGVLLLPATPLSMSLVRLDEGMVFLFTAMLGIDSWFAPLGPTREVAVKSSTVIPTWFGVFSSQTCTTGDSRSDVMWLTSFDF